MDYIAFWGNNPLDPVVGQAVAGWVILSPGCSERSEAAKSKAARCPAWPQVTPGREGGMGKYNSAPPNVSFQLPTPDFC